MTSKFALVIANTEYQDASFAKLTAPGKDAEEFAQVLRDAEFAAFDDVQILLNEGEGKTRRSIARFFAERKPADLLLLYFSGHGVRNEQGQLFLAANDTEINILEASGIPAEFITYAMNNSRSQRQLLILDCCNSGAFAHGSKSASGVGKSMGIATAFEGDGYGRVVLTATDATQFAWEGDKVIGDTQKSVFTHFLIEGLKGEADRDSDGRIHVDELYDYAYEQVVRRTPKQTPGKWSYKQQGDIILRENLKPRDVKPAPLPSDLLELLSHPNSGVRKAGVQDLISLLEGKHLGLTRAAEEKLREIAANDDSFTLRKTASDTLIARGLFSEQPAYVPVETLKEENKIKKLPEASSPTMGEVRGDIIFPRRLNKQKKKAPTLNISTGLMRRLRLAGAILGGFLAMSLLVWGGSRLLRNLSLATPEITPTSQSELDIGLTIFSDKDGMTLLYIPAGEFTMGSENSEEDEKPVHPVYLDAYWMDETEVTNAMFAKCVQAGSCDKPSDTTYYDDSNYANHPVVYVSWNNANAYCAWASRRLPTEAEWEKAASWNPAANEKFVYPWGNDFSCAKGNFDDETQIGSYVVPGGENCDGFPRTSPVGSFTEGISPYGLLDMVGNVWEWVSSSYKPYPYDANDGRENLTSSDLRVLRGGSWFLLDNDVRSADRIGYDPASAFDNFGFRCAISEAEQVGFTPSPQTATVGPQPNATYTNTSEPAGTNTPSPTQNTISPAPTLGIGSSMISEKDGMTLLYVPAGEFTMGSDNGDSDEKPVHKVNQDSYWIDQTEVTNEKYALCVRAVKCDAPRDTDRFVKTGYANHPVIYVSWNAAKAYCAWADRRLPTEAEWEKAARGPDGLIYPWGNETPDTGLLNYNNEIGGTTEAGNYPNGASPYGALDMAGNAYEWVEDWYGKTYYASSPVSNPLGPNSGQSRVLRGGAWYYGANSVRSANRGVDDPLYTGNDVGFRCAMSATP